MTPSSSIGVYHVSKLRTIQDAVKTLSSDMNLVLQYFFLNCLNESFRSILVSITNNSKPALEETNKYFFEACERYKDKKECVSTASFAAKVDFTKKSEKERLCILCSGTHNTSKCSVFASPVEQISQIK